MISSFLCVLQLVRLLPTSTAKCSLDSTLLYSTQTYHVKSSVFLNLFVHIISSSHSFFHIAYMMYDVDYGVEINVRSDLIKPAEY